MVTESKRNLEKKALLGFLFLIILYCSTINDVGAVLDFNYLPILNSFKIYDSDDIELNSNVYLIKGEKYRININITYASYVEFILSDGFHNITLSFTNSTKSMNVIVTPNESGVISVNNKEYLLRKSNTEFILNYTITLGEYIRDYFNYEIIWNGYSTLVGEYVGYTVDDYEIQSEYVNGGGPLLSWENDYTVRNTMYRDSGQNKMFRSNVDAYEEYMRTLLIINVDYDSLYSVTPTDYRHILWYVGTSHGTMGELRLSHKTYGLFVGMSASDEPLLHSFSTKADNSLTVGGFGISLNENIYMVITRRNNMVQFDYYLDGFNITLLDTETMNIGFTDKLDFSVIGSTFALLGNHLAQSRTSYIAYDFEQTGGSFSYTSGWYWEYNTTSFIINIFNEGGIPVYTFNGDGSIVPYEDILSIQANGNGAWSKVEVIYDKLQHMHFLVTFDIDGDWSINHWTNLTGGFFEYGMDYQFNGTFLNGWKVRLYPSSFNVGHYGLGVDYDWVQWTIEHYNYNRTTSLYDLLKEDILYSNFYGYDSEQSDKGYINNTSVSFWVDLWFSNEYSSSKIGTRVNTEYYGMYEQGNSFWFGYGAFRPMFGNETLSLFLDNIYDGNSDISTVKNNVRLVKFWGRVEKVTGGDKTYKMYNYVMKNKVQALSDMIGVDVPALVDTKVIDMPQSGFLTPLIKIISSIGDMFKNALIAVLWYIIGAIDSILETFGLPSGFMTTMIDWIILQASVIFTWMGLVAQYAEDILYIFVSFANTVISFMGYIIAGITWIIIWVLPIPIHIVTFVIAIFTSGVWVYGGYTWDFSSYSAITDAFWSIMPIIITWVFMLWLFMGDDDDIGGFPKRLVQTFTFIKDAYNDIFWIYTRMANSIISMYNFIRSHIPFLSSGGGEQDEG